ncbi:MAG: ABC transporter substrate-binding protein [Pseudomonadota bacterium]
MIGFHKMLGSLSAGAAQRLFAAAMVLALLGGLSLAPARASDEAGGEDPMVESATSFVGAFTKRAFDAFANDGVALEARQEAFQDVLADGLAIDFLGRVMLGSQKDEATAEQLARYEDLFPRYITRIYAEQIDEIAQKDLKIVKAAKRGAKDVYVRTQFVRAADETTIPVDWRVRRANSGAFKVIDVSVRGVSIMLVKRDEFGAVISTLGFDALLQLMELKLASPFGSPTPTLPPTTGSPADGAP